MTGKRSIQNVVLVDEQSLSRAALRALLEHELDWRVVSDCAEPDAVQAAATHAAPAVVLVALRDPRSALALVSLLAAVPGTPCVRLDTRASPDAVKSAFDAGALGYLVRDDGAPDLAQALHCAATGQRYVSPLASTTLVDYLQRRAPMLAHDALTPRQLEVLRLVAQGKNTKTIARDLGLSSRTVDAHRYQISRRLQVHDVAGMVRYAIHHALVGSEP